MGQAERNNPFNTWKREAAVSQFEIYDAYGRLIRKGDLVVIPHMGATRWRVASTKPVLDPKAPAGTILLTLSAVSVEAVQGGVPQPVILKVADAIEFKDSPTDEEPETPPAAEEPPPPAPGLVSLT